MGEYATKVKGEDGKTKWQATDGKTYSTRSGAWKWSKKLESDKGKEGKAGPSATETPPDTTHRIGAMSDTGAKKEGAEAKSDSPPPPPSEPHWSTFDFADDSDFPTETVPAVLKRISPSQPAAKKTKKQIEAEQQTSTALLGVGYRSADLLLTRYKRAVTRDKNAEAIKHSDEDIDWISGITNDALIHSDIHLANAFSPVSIAVVANGYWFGKPIYSIQKEAKGSPLRGAGRFMEWIPFLGKRLKARRLASEAERDAREVVQA